MTAGPEDALLFAEKLLALLDSGRYTATYKFAVLTALIDVCIESVDENGNAPSTVSGRRVGQRVLELFWRHAIPYRAEGDSIVYLHHSTQSQDLVRKITTFRQEHHLGPGMTVERARAVVPTAFAGLEDDVISTVIRMPLPRLQRFSTGGGFREDRFLYDFDWPDEVSPARVRATGFDDTLRLRPGVGSWLVRLAGVLRPIVQQRWSSFVAERSREVVEESWLDDFLFESTRADLGPVRLPLLEAQRGNCFYCDAAIQQPSAEVDHFIPWSRHPDNGMENLVVAHRRCNNAKRDSLAAETHVAKWLPRFVPSSPERRVLDDVKRSTKWPSRPDRTLGSARASYLWIPSGTLLWEGVERYRAADPSLIREVFGTEA